MGEAARVLEPTLEQRVTELEERMLSVEQGRVENAARIDRWLMIQQSSREADVGVEAERDLRLHRLETAINLRPDLHEQVRRVEETVAGLMDQISEALTRVAQAGESAADYERRWDELHTALTMAAVGFQQAARATRATDDPS